MKSYFRVFDLQRNCYFGTGYNSTSKKDLIESFQSYILGANEINFEHEEGTDEYKKELNDFLGTWELIEDYLQGVQLEESDVEFKDYE